jgi:TPR repeat protein
MNDQDPLWADLDALDKSNDLEGAIALGEASALGEEPRFTRYIAWAFTERQDLLSAGRWYAKSHSLGAEKAEAEFQLCLRRLYEGGFTREAAQLAGTPPMEDREGTHRTMVSLHFAANDSDGLLDSSLRLATVGRPSDVRYAGEVLLSRGDADGAFPYMKQAAEDGDSLASQSLGEMYYRGIGAAQSEELAESAYRPAARDGFILSRSRLAHIAHSRTGRRFDVAFISAMIAITTRALWLRLVRPDDARLWGLPK